MQHILHQAEEPFKHDMVLYSIIAVQNNITIVFTIELLKNHLFFQCVVKLVYDRKNPFWCYREHFQKGSL